MIGGLSMRVRERPLEEALKIEAAIGRDTWASDEGRQGAAAFAAGKGRSASFED